MYVSGLYILAHGLRTFPNEQEVNPSTYSLPPQTGYQELMRVGLLAPNSPLTSHRVARISKAKNVERICRVPLLGDHRGWFFSVLFDAIWSLNPPSSLPHLLLVPQISQRSSPSSLPRNLKCKRFRLFCFSSLCAP